MRRIAIIAVYIQLWIATMVYFQEFRCSDYKDTEYISSLVRCQKDSVIVGAFWPLYWSARVWKAGIYATRS